MGGLSSPSRAVITLCSSARLGHLRNQLEALDGSGAHTVVVWLDAEAPPTLPAERILHVPPGREGFRLAAARNAGADAAVSAGAELLVFLDADCVPGRDLLGRYAEASAEHDGAVLCGPVTYLRPGIDALDPAAIEAATAPHPARPAPSAGETTIAGLGEYRLFWSLSFAMTASGWQLGPRFDERYVGYGGEDTDFAYRLRAAGRPLVWVGGAHAYHQHHPTSSPPVEHLDDILRNGGLFATEWGEWPMEGWLDSFEKDGWIRRDGSGWRRTPRRSDSPRR